MEPKYAIVVEANMDSPISIVQPASGWLAMALNGWLLPPVETYLRDAERADDEPKEHPYARPIGPMNEEDAMEYLVQRCVPRHIWDAPSNRPRFAIVRRGSIPADRTHRNAWRMADFTRIAS